MPCCFDAWSARLIEAAGFPLTFMSGFAVSAARLALPDTGLISYGAPPGGGTTDWAVDIYYKAVSEGRYTCFLGPDSQLDAAVAYLSANEGDVKLITITIGANDLLACGQVPTPECIQAALGGAVSNLQVIVGTLRTVAPDVPIVAMNYYNPNLAYALTPGGEALAAQSNVLAVAANDAIEAVYAAFGVPVADVESAFRTTDERGRRLPANVATICWTTGMCDRVNGQWQLAAEPDIHPNDWGYRKIAWVFIRTMRSADIL